MTQIDAELRFLVFVFVLVLAFVLAFVIDQDNHKYDQTKSTYNCLGFSGFSRPNPNRK